MTALAHDEQPELPHIALQITGQPRTVRQPRSFSFTITGDMDFMISYGILEDITFCTIEYVNEDEDAPAPQEQWISRAFPCRWHSGRV